MSTVNEAPHPNDTGETRPCTYCKRGRIPANDYRKRCASCREKSRMYSARSTEKKRVLLASLSQGQPGAPVPALPMQKRKAGVDTTKDVPLEALKFKKIRKTKIAEHEQHPGGEYQTAEDMYGYLKSVFSKSKEYDFFGHFSIVANLATGNKSRVKIVAQDLVDIAQIPFESKSMSSFSSTKDTFSATFQCTCLGRKPVSNIPLSYDSHVIATPTPGKDALQKAETSFCKGRVSLTVQNDMSHPLGIAGQKIIVEVKH